MHEFIFSYIIYFWVLKKEEVIILITNNMEFTYDELVATCYVLYGGKRTPKIIIEFIKMYQLIKKEHFKNTKLAALKGVFYTEEDGTWNLIKENLYQIYYLI